MSPPVRHQFAHASMRPASVRRAQGARRAAAFGRFPTPAATPIPQGKTHSVDVDVTMANGGRNVIIPIGSVTPTDNHITFTLAIRPKHGAPEEAVQTAEQPIEDPDEPAEPLGIWKLQKLGGRKLKATRRKPWCYRTKEGKVKIMGCEKPKKLPSCLLNYEAVDKAQHKKDEDELKRTAPAFYKWVYETHKKLREADLLEEAKDKVEEAKREAKELRRMLNAARPE